MNCLASFLSMLLSLATMSCLLSPDFLLLNFEISSLVLIGFLPLTSLKIAAHQKLFLLIQIEIYFLFYLNNFDPDCFTVIVH